MAQGYISEIRMMSFTFAPKGWALCNGATLPINQNQALFSLLGTTYGGNGQTTFALPNLQGRVPMHIGNGFLQGQAGGEENHTLNMGEMPAHTHFANADVKNGNNTASDPVGTYPANTGGIPMYSSGSANMTAMYPQMVSNAGGSQAHTNQQPFSVISFCICLQGIFPSRN